MTKTFNDLLADQIANEFGASQQYVAIATWFDDHDLPQLARHFYRQSLEERNHAMMFVKYRLDRDLGVVIPGAAVPERTEFTTAVDAIKFSLEQELRVTTEIEALFAAARAETDALGEQFMLWFLKEQVEEVASMRTLLTVAERADNVFDLENYMARETMSDDSSNAIAAPPAAGGAV